MTPATPSAESSDTGPTGSRTTYYVLIVLAVLVAVPLIGALGLGWAENNGFVGRAEQLPHWVTPNEVMATTSDGAGVRARVSLDITESASRKAIESNLRQYELLLELCISSHVREEIGGASGMQVLADEMRQRLNDQLASSGAPEAVRSVAVQQLVIAKP